MKVISFGKYKTGRGKKRGAQVIVDGVTRHLRYSQSTFDGDMYTDCHGNKYTIKDSPQ